LDKTSKILFAGGGVALIAAFLIYMSKARTDPNWNPFAFRGRTINNG